MAEKCRACQGEDPSVLRAIGVLDGDRCPACHGTGVEPAPLSCCYRDTCAEAREKSSIECPEVALRSRLAAVVEAGERMSRFIESASYLHGSDGERACALLAAWKKVLG